MDSTTIAIQGDRDVQPGWIYIRGEKRFYPPKDKTPLIMETTPKLFQVEEIPEQEIKKFKNKDKIWENDRKHLKKTETFKLIVCFITCEKFIKEPVKGTINYEYASRVYYFRSITAMIVYDKGKDISIQDIRQTITSSNKESIRNEVHTKVNAAYIYYNDQLRGKCSFKLTAQEAFKKIFDYAKNIETNDSFVSAHASVNRLPCNVSNKSINMSKIDRSNKNCSEKSIFQKVFDYLFPFGRKSKKKESRIYLELESISMQSVFDPLTPLEPNAKKLRISPENIINTQNQSNYSVELPNEGKHTSESSSLSPKRKEPAQRNLLATTEITVVDAIKSERSKTAPPELKKKSENRKKQQGPTETKKKGSFIHNYYHCSDNEDIANNKALLLFGTDDCGKLALLNLAWHFSLNDDKKTKAKPIVDTSSKVESITFYHIGAISKEPQELILITTPAMTTGVLLMIKQLLSEGVLNVHALGFVVNSRSETLTSEERSFFSFLRSSFGEVSNQHLITFLMDCDFSRNFAILDELKNQSIKPKCTLELNNSEFSGTKETDISDLETKLIDINLKKMKKVFKTLKDMPFLSVKTIKLAQEKSFAITHLATSSRSLIEELQKFSNLVEQGDLVDITISVQEIWRLAKLVFAMEGSQYSENELLQFVANKLIAICPVSEKALPFRCFLILVFNNIERNINVEFMAAMTMYNECLSAILTCPSNPNCLSLHNDTILLFCAKCRDIHTCKRDPKSEATTIMDCQDCKCIGREHTLWGKVESNNLSQAVCKAIGEDLRAIYNELPKLPFYSDFNSFCSVQSELNPCLDKILKKCSEITPLV